MKIWLVIWFFINGQWVVGDSIDGWGRRPQADIPTCFRLQENMREWFKKVEKIELPDGRVVTDLQAVCNVTK
jgi:hypothetical protein